MAAVGPKIIIADIMTNKNNNDHKDKLRHIAELLKFALSLGDEEILKSTVESAIELLEEEIGE